MEKKRKDWFDQHVEVISYGLPKKETERFRRKLKEGLKEEEKNV